MAGFNSDLPDAFPLGQKATVIDDNLTVMSLSHGFALNESVFYEASIERPNGEIWHRFTNGKRSDHLIEGEFLIRG